MEEGYIKLSRNILYNQFLMNDEKAFSLFVKLLLTVDWKTGSTLTGRKKLAKLTGYKETTVYNALLRLQNEEMVRLDSHKTYTKITICNWSKWQENRQNVVTTHRQRGDNPGDNLIDINPINKINGNDSHGDNPRISQVAGGDTIQEEEEYNINNPSSKSSGSVNEDKDSELRAELQALMNIVNPKEKLTPGRVTLLRARKREKYTFEEIKKAAQEFSRSKWHKENKQMSIDNLLRPSKFGNWYQKSQESQKGYVIPGSVPTSRPIPEQEKELTLEQKERGKLIKDLLMKGEKLIAVSGKTNDELRELLSVK